MPNKALQTDKIKLSCPLLLKRTRQLAFASEEQRYAAKSDQHHEVKYENQGKSTINGVSVHLIHVLTISLLS